MSSLKKKIQFIQKCLELLARAILGPEFRLAKWPVRRIGLVSLPAYTVHAYTTATTIITTPYCPFLWSPHARLKTLSYPTTPSQDTTTEAT